MKKERGSALLTVILITFVTATIGAAVSSFIMMNYRLRALDNKIGRAEYEAEKIMDVAYLAVQKGVNENIQNAKLVAKKYVYEQMQLDETYCRIEGGGPNEYDFVKIDNAEETKYNEYYYTVLESFIGGQIDDIASFVTYNPNTFNDNTEDEIKIARILNKLSESKYKLTIYYKLKNAPVITISATFVIGMPTYEQAYGYEYNLNELVGMTDWEMQDWGYL